MTRRDRLRVAILLLLAAACVAGTAAPSRADGRKLAIVVGVNAYRATSGLPRLGHAAADAQRIGQVLRTTGFDVVEMTHAASRSDGSEHLAPNCANIQDQIEAVLGIPNLGSNDTVLITLHGHGAYFPPPEGDKQRTAKFYFCPTDARTRGIETVDQVTTRSRLLGIEDLYASLGACGAGTKLLVVDACRNNPNQPQPFRSGVASVTLPRLPPPPRGMAAFFSCSAGQMAIENSDLGQGVFSHFFAKGLEGDADQPALGRPGDGIVTIAELTSYVANNTGTFVRMKHGGLKQDPDMKGEFNANLPLSTPGWDEAKEPAGPDPLRFFREAALAAHEAQSISVDFTVCTRVTRDDDVVDSTAALRYRTARDMRFDFRLLSISEQEQTPRFYVAGNNRVMMMAFTDGKHTIRAGEQGFADFVDSPYAESFASGLGGLALAFLHPDAVDGLIESVESSEFVGKEYLRGQPAYRVRFSVKGSVTSDVWFAGAGPPVVLRLKPAVLDLPAVQEMAKEHDRFDYRLRFDFDNWDLNADLDEDDIPLREPEESELVYPAGDGPPHTILGEPAPAATLPIVGGGEVDLAKEYGEKIVMLEFWSTWCEPCLKSMPLVQQVADKYRQKGLAYYPICIHEDSPKQLNLFLEKKGMSPFTLFDKDSEFAERCRLTAFPLVLVVSSDKTVQMAELPEGIYAEDFASSIERVIAGERIGTQKVTAWQAEQERLRSLLDR